MLNILILSWALSAVGRMIALMTVHYITKGSCRKSEWELVSLYISSLAAELTTPTS